MGETSNNEGKKKIINPTASTSSKRIMVGPRNLDLVLGVAGVAVVAVVAERLCFTITRRLEVLAAGVLSTTTSALSAFGGTLAGTSLTSSIGVDSCLDSVCVSSFFFSPSSFSFSFSSSCSFSSSFLPDSDCCTEASWLSSSSSPLNFLRCRR